MSRTISLSKNYDEALTHAKAALKSGGVLIYPTDTLYGLGCNALSERAVQKIYAIKSRDKGKPLSILVSDYAMLLECCEVSSAQERILHALLPGPYTFILPLRKPIPVSMGTTVQRASASSSGSMSDAFSRGKRTSPSASPTPTGASGSSGPLAAERQVGAPQLTIGVRVPEHMFMRQVSKELGMPIVSTSANLSGGKDAAVLKDVSSAVSSKADLLIDGGKCLYAQGSTVIDLIDMKILRKGAIRKGDKFEFAD